ncbi:hypothetical protein ACPOL_5922 [Acidisarcina polymorpha]|uniref:Ribonuclease VapC n=1 Tax=Acidisarcina polymorpha TaxID=2211140 RepID=A0A2Z5G9D8_9BACT|nr:PIN domain nuclease [Acidisarcina polymorpha]AXC15166.1 hypothetical protein ACPOL_5922 [Acidisarcina polymorpha]
MILVDSTVWIDYLGGTINPHTDWLDRELAVRRLGLTDLILYEVLQGVRGDATFRRVHRELSKFQLFNGGGEEIAIAAAQNYRNLRAQGVTVRKSVDCLIATFCLWNGHALLHRDRDFDPYEKHFGLQVVHP